MLVVDHQSFYFQININLIESKTWSRKTCDKSFLSSLAEWAQKFKFFTPTGSWLYYKHVTLTLSTLTLIFCAHIVREVNLNFLYYTPEKFKKIKRRLVNFPSQRFTYLVLVVITFIMWIPHFLLHFKYFKHTRPLCKKADRVCRVQKDDKKESSFLIWPWLFYLFCFR